jgi:hypothetical protein
MIEFREATTLEFILYNSGTFDLLRKFVVVDRNDSEIEQWAKKFGLEGLRPLTLGMRFLNPCQCLQWALDSRRDKIFFVRESDINIETLRAIQQEIAGK